MPVYDRPVRLLVHDLIKALQVKPGQVLTRQQVLQWFREHYPKVKPGTVTSHLTRMSVNAPSRVHYSVRKGEDDLLFQIDGSHFRLYDSTSDPAPIYEDSSVPDPTSPDEVESGEDDADAASEFAYESDLRDFLAKNLSIIEPGLRLYQEEEIVGIEFPAGGRFIDILAVDAQGALVVVELKVSRGYDRVIGQLLRYIGWVRTNLAEKSQAVRGVIVAREISQDLCIACSQVLNVNLFEYKLGITLRRIEQTVG